MKSNFHTHTYRCKHASGTELEMVQKAIECGLSHIGISDHAPFMDIDYGYRMDYSELDEYLEQIDAAKDLTQVSIKVFKGLEIEYLEDYAGLNSEKFNYYEYLLKDKKLDYLLLGEHMFTKNHNLVRTTNRSKRETSNAFFLSETSELLDYALSCREAMETGYFAILAHPDLFMINDDFGWDSNCEKAAEIIIESAVKNNVVLEYNANGLRRGIQVYPDGQRFPYPHKSFWLKAKEAKASVIVGSDCHNPDLLWDEYVETAFNQLRELGITPVDSIFPA